MTNNKPKSHQRSNTTNAAKSRRSNITNAAKSRRSNTTNAARSRRSFVKTAGAIAASTAFSPIPTIARGRLEKPALLGIGTGGKGRTDLEQCKKAGFEIVALADVVDARRLSEIKDRRTRSVAQTRSAFPQAVFGTDYRELLSDLGDQIDGVVVSTPDHHHFHASAQAMLAGKHVYCQKPLTHGIWEARMMSQLANMTGVKTQMGNQAHANDHMRRCVELVRAGIVGKVRAIHTWTNRPIWPQGFAAPPQEQPVPTGLDWKQWIGPAPAIAYSPLIAPFNWRGWWDYGTGALGDMACHIMDCGFWAMNPTAPTAVRAEQNGATDLSPPINSSITWEFPANDFSAPEGFTFHWYDGYIHAAFDESTWTLKKEREEYNHPSDEILSGVDFSKYGSVIIGDQGKLFFHRSNPAWTLHTNHRVERFEWPTESLPRAREQNNYVEWFDAVTGKIDQGQSNFLHAGPFTETILLGVLAQRNPGERLVWDSLNLAVKDRTDLDRFIRREYAEGWSAKQLLGLDA